MPRYWDFNLWLPSTRSITEYFDEMSTEFGINPKAIPALAAAINVLNSSKEVVLGWDETSLRGGYLICKKTGKVLGSAEKILSPEMFVGGDVTKAVATSIMLFMVGTLDGMYKRAIAWYVMC